MKRVSSGILAAIVAAGFGLTPSRLRGDVWSQGNIGTYANAAPTGRAGRAVCHPQTSARRLRAKCRSSSTIITFIRNPIVEAKPRSRRTRARQHDPRPAALDVRANGRDGLVRSRHQDGRRLEAGFRRQGDGRQAGSRHQRRSRPLDVPPEIYKGVGRRARPRDLGRHGRLRSVGSREARRRRPLRAAGPAADAGSAAPPTPATPKPTANRPAADADADADAGSDRSHYEHFIAGDYIFSPKVYNEFSPGNTGIEQSYAVKGAFEFPPFGLPWMLEGDYRSVPATSTARQPGRCRWPVHCPDPPASQDCVTAIGGYWQAYVPAFTAREATSTAASASRSPIRASTSASATSSAEQLRLPQQTGVGFGAEKLPDLESAVLGLR